MARGACGVGERYVGWAERDRRKKTDRVGMLRGEFTLQLYRRLCERGFAVGRYGGDAAAYFGGALLGCFAVREPALEQPDFCGGVLCGRGCLCLPLQIIKNFVTCRNTLEQFTNEMS